ncbi:hypothetical protein PFICI_04739 [Pestalotiopsis fici W106-1]|uniref:L-asparaginase II n=1 Tax=Pestalotiopsis fici (strain W106-1 / CGMCC3.15140) TaxID=1229662 RepID=W3X9S6_PESFW|nr:uncharacterized protein PFICI_04739 [Pestalotiopsis fici W106-1]ETS82863.1 hypothetical protein PFICI_04739 [Pestalotiopsis fici W106-1]
MHHRDCVVTDRGGVIENRHQVHAAVVDAKGKLLFAVGNPHRVTLARSAAKPAQTLAILETGAFDPTVSEGADIALMCASHSAEDRHLQRTYDMLKRIGAEEEDLRCGGHAALSDKVNRMWIKNDFVPGPATNNCSGKHCGMIAGSKALGASVENYHLPDHPMQMRVKQVVSDLTAPNIGNDEVQWALDGCNLPAPAFPLRCLAGMYASFADAADGNHDIKTERHDHMARVFNSMVEFPEYVGGDDRYCTELMRAYAPSLIGKLGADGCYGVGIRASADTERLGATGALGIAVKIEDGSIEILYAAVTEILEQLQIGTSEQRKKLDHFHHLERRNTVNTVTGKVTLAFSVRPNDEGAQAL